jgi:hypothetical protein
MSDIRNNTINIKNKTLAIDAAPAAMPPNPKMAAIIATTRKITVQRNIILKFSFKKCCSGFQGMGLFKQT